MLSSWIQPFYDCEMELQSTPCSVICNVFENSSFEFSDFASFKIGLSFSLGVFGSDSYSEMLTSLVKHEKTWMVCSLQDSLAGSLLLDGPVLPVLLIACNRDAAVHRSLDLLLKHRPSQERFPIIVSQDCGHRPTKEVIESYGDKVTLIQVWNRTLLIIWSERRGILK